MMNDEDICVLARSSCYENKRADFISWRYTGQLTGIGRICNSQDISLRGCAFKFL